MAFSRWDPFRDLLALHDHIGQLVGSDAPGWTPPADLFETAGTYVLTIEVPGLAREHIDIHAEESRIVVRGERTGAQAPCEQYHRIERGHGRFSRAFLLPEPIDTDSVNAVLEDGLLTVTIPKAGGRGARRVDVA